MKMRKILALLLALTMVVSLVACGAEQGSASPTQATTADGDTVISMMLEVDASTKFLNGDSASNNIITRFFEEKLGIVYDFSWQVDTGNYSTQLDLAIAGNTKLPDQFIATKEQISNLAKTGKIQDMTTVFENHASDALKEVLGFNDGEGFTGATIDGKLYGIPLPNDVGDGASLIFIRKDWMEKLNLSEPKTLYDLIDIASAFVDNNVSGKSNTLGIGLASDLGFTWDVFANANGAYPNLWVDDGSGNLVYGSIQPEVKEGLLLLQDAFKKGLIHQEFAVQDTTRIAQMIAQGRLGIMIGPFWYNNLYLTSNMNADPNAEWVAYAPLPLKEGDEVATRAWNTTYRWLVVNSDFANPELVVEQLNLWLEIWQGQYSDWYWEQQLSDTYYNIDLKDYSAVFFDPPLKNITLGSSIRTALETGDTSALNAEGVYNYTSIVSPKDGEGSVLQKMNIITWQQSFKILGESYESFVYDEFRGPHTSDYTSKMNILKEIETEAFVKIIMGADISEFDKFVNTWLKAGGEKATTIVNEWYHNQNK